MQRLRLHLSSYLFALAILLPFSWNVFAAVVPALEAIQPASIGVDASGNLWAWDREDGSVYSYAPDGSQKGVAVPMTVLALDANREWGIAALDEHGSLLRLSGWNGYVTLEEPLTVRASSVCWIDEDHVAIAPQFGPTQVVIWNVTEGRRDLAFGNIESVDMSSAGARVAHATHLRFDVAHNEIIALDAYFGRLSVYSREGDLVREAELSHPLRESTDAWLQTADEERKRLGTAFRPLIWSYPTLTLDAEGTLWVGESDTEAESQLVGIERDGSIVRKSIRSRCPSIRFQIWQGNYLFYRDPQSPRPYCIVEQRSEG